jgi:hypothetical protein
MTTRACFSHRQTKHESLGSGFFQVPAEPVAHGGKQPVLVVCISP